MHSLREEAVSLIGDVDTSFLRLGKAKMQEYFMDKYKRHPDLVIFFWFSSYQFYDGIRAAFPNCKIALWTDDIHFVNDATRQSYKQCDVHICHYPQHLEHFYGEKMPPAIKLPHSPSSFFMKSKINKNSINKIFFYGNSDPAHYPERSWFINYMKKNMPDNLVLKKHPGYESGGTANDCTSSYLTKYTFSFTSGGLAFASKLKPDSKTQYYFIGKFFEIPASGSLLLCNETRVAIELEEFGFKDMINCVFLNASNIKERLDWLFDPKNADQINRIRETGHRFVIENHSLHKHVDNVNKKLIEFAVPNVEPVVKSKFITQKITPPKNKLCFAINNNSIEYISEYYRSAVEFFNAESLIYDLAEKIVFDPEKKYIFFACGPNEIFADEIKEKITVLNVTSLTKYSIPNRITHLQECAVRGIKLLSYSAPKYFAEIAPMIYYPTIIYDSESVKLKALHQKYKHDIVFCGAITPYRKECLDHLESSGLTILKLENLFGDKLDEKIASGKILLNLNMGGLDVNIYESIKYDRWLGAGKIIVTEKCDPETYYGSNEFLFETNFESMATLLKDILAKFEKYQTELGAKLPLIKKISDNRKQKCLDLILNA
jgi:hypothetical protein